MYFSAYHQRHRRSYGSLFILFYNGLCHWRIHLHMANCFHKMVESERSLLTVIILWATHTLAHIFPSNDEKSIAPLSTYTISSTRTSDRAIWVWYYECLSNEKEWRKHAIISENVCVCANLDRQPLTTVIQNSVCRTASKLIRCRPPQPQISACRDVCECSWLYMSGGIMCSRKSSHSHYSNNNRISNAAPENCTNTSPAFSCKRVESESGGVRDSAIAIAV